MVTAELFRALGDPIRLEMVRRISNSETHSLGSVTNDLGITRQGARKHLQLLANAHIVTLKPRGRETFVYLDSKTLKEGREFIADIEQQWDGRLELLRHFVEDVS